MNFCEIFAGDGPDLDPDLDSDLFTSALVMHTKSHA